MNRKLVKSTLFTSIAALQFDLGGGLVGFNTASPKLRHWNDVSPSAQPAFFLSQGPQTPRQPAASGGPRAWDLDFWARIYVNTAGEADPADVLDPILDAIDQFLSPVGGVPQTLGGLVQWTRIEGTIETFEGTLGDQEVALIPIRALAT